MTSRTLPLTLQRTGDKITVEMDRDRFEHLADSLGFFGVEFLESLERTEGDIRAGRVKKLRSLRDLRTST